MAKKKPAGPPAKGGTAATASHVAASASKTPTAVIAQPLGDLQVEMVDPRLLAPGNNYRFSLKPSRVESLAANIVAMGEVHTPLEVTRLNQMEGGKMFRVQDGAYRLAAVTMLSGRGVTIKVPIRIVPETGELEALDRQRSHNTERENESPIDKAIAIKKYVDGGVPRDQILEKFPSPDGRNAGVIKPLSPSMMTILLSFLEFPQDIQEKIHNGELGVGAAYKLSKYPSTEWAAILADIEAARIKEVEMFEKLDEKLLETTKRIETKEQELTKAQTDALEATSKLESLRTQAQVAVDKTAEVRRRLVVATGEEKDKAKADEAAAEAAAKAAAELYKQAKTDADRKDTAAKKLVEAVQAAKAKIGAAQAIGAPAKPIAASEVDRSGSRVSAGTGARPALTAVQMREAVKTMSLPNGKHEMVRKVGKALEMCFSGGFAENYLTAVIAVLIGESKAESRAAVKNVVAQVEEALAPKKK